VLHHHLVRLDAPLPSFQSVLDPRGSHRDRSIALPIAAKLRWDQKDHDKQRKELLRVRGMAAERRGGQHT